MSMAAQAAHLWSVATLFLASAGNPGGAHLLAVAQPARARCRTLHPADAKGPDPNECATAHCLERSERSEWASDHPRLAGGRARCKSLGSVARFTLSGQRRGDGAKFAGELERIICSNCSKPWTPTTFTTNKCGNATSNYGATWPHCLRAPRCPPQHRSRPCPARSQENKAVSASPANPWETNRGSI